MNTPHILNQVYYDGVMAGFTCMIYKTEGGRTYFKHQDKRGNTTFCMSCPTESLQVVNSGTCRWAVHYNNCRPEATS